MEALYNIVIHAFTFFVKLVSPFNGKAGLWVNGRRDWYDNLKAKVNPDDKYIWIHCASLGEFEQGRPVIEAIKRKFPRIKIILTFFSPSGYEIRKNYPMADIICYLPADTPGNAQKFISLINPVMVIFVKYEFWYNYISELAARKIQIYLISGIFRNDQHFFKWHGAFFRKILNKFTWFFVQDTNSYSLLESIGLRNITITGDTRFDRVVEIAATAKEIPVIEQFRGNEKLFMAGSSWRGDEEIIAKYINLYPDRMKWVFAPHEIDKSNTDRIEKLLDVKTVKFSAFNKNDSDARVLIIDNIGMLSSAYRYASIAVVGGGFGKGIHNILEPACWGIPVLFGPRYHKFPEAHQLLETGGTRTFKDYSGFESIMNGFITDENSRKLSAEAAGKYVSEKAGATKKIMKSLTQSIINKGYS
jgi:3-deoxy-D-manno-octulosonic-acid transferase